MLTQSYEGVFLQGPPGSGSGGCFQVAGVVLTTVTQRGSSKELEARLDLTS